MTKAELQSKIKQMKESASTLDEPERTLKLSDIDQLEIAIIGMETEEISKIMESIELPKIQEMDVAISKAIDATSANDQKIKYLDTACSLIKSVLKIAI